MTALAGGDSVDPVRTFTAALPHHARRHFYPDYRTNTAIRACADRGDDLTTLAAACAKGTSWRTPHDTRGLIIMRLLRTAGTAEEGG